MRDRMFGEGLTELQAKLVSQPAAVSGELEQLPVLALESVLGGSATPALRPSCLC